MPLLVIITQFVEHIMKINFNPTSFFLLRMDGKDHTIYTPHQYPFYVMISKKGVVITVEKRCPTVKPFIANSKWEVGGNPELARVAETETTIKEWETLHEIHHSGQRLTVTVPSKTAELKCEIPVPLPNDTESSAAYKPVLDGNHDPVVITRSHLLWDYLLKHGMLFRTKEEAALAQYGIHSALIRLNEPH